MVYFSVKHFPISYFTGIASYCSPPLLPASARIVHGEVITANGGGADSGINENDDISSEVICLNLNFPLKYYKAFREMVAYNDTQE